MEDIDKLILLHTQQLKVLNKLKDNLNDKKTLEKHKDLINKINEIYLRNI